MLNYMVENIALVSWCFSSVDFVSNVSELGSSKVDLLMQKGCLMKCLKIGMILFDISVYDHPL